MGVTAGKQVTHSSRWQRRWVDDAGGEKPRPPPAAVIAKGSKAWAQLVWTLPSASQSTAADLGCPEQWARLSGGGPSHGYKTVPGLAQLYASMCFVLCPRQLVVRVMGARNR